MATCKILYCSSCEETHNTPCYYVPEESGEESENLGVFDILVKPPGRAPAQKQMTGVGSSQKIKVLLCGFFHFLQSGDMLNQVPFLYDMVWNVNAHLLQSICVCVCDSKPNMLKHTYIRIAHIKNISSSQNCDKVYNSRACPRCHSGGGHR